MIKITFDYLGKYGQLGNQMFQYALLVGVKYKIGADLIINSEVKNASYLFDFFDLREYIIEDNCIKNIYKETEFSFDSNVFNITTDTNFMGYFQSEKYFSHCTDEIKNEYSFKDNVLGKVNNIINKYKDKTLVSMHIRRGDYVFYQDYHPLVPIEYYNNSMDLLDGDDILFLCVSDDIDWCKQKFKRTNIVFYNEGIPYDMCLISKCKNHIIANSTFSWWGSWLSDNVDKTIVAPKNWFGIKYANYNPKDLYCENFIIL